MDISKKTVAYMRVGSQEQLETPIIRIGVYIRALDEYSLAVQKVYYDKKFADTEKYTISYFIELERRRESQKIGLAS